MRRTKKTVFFEKGDHFTGHRLASGELAQNRTHSASFALLRTRSAGPRRAARKELNHDETISTKPELVLLACRRQPQRNEICYKALLDSCVRGRSDRRGDRVGR